MRGTTGRSSRVSTKLKAAVLALLAIFAVSAFGASSANAAQQVKLSFNDSWIKVDALGDTGKFHALDPEAENPQKVDLAGSLAKDGSFLAKKTDFAFPDQNIPSPLGVINLHIEAAADITGNYATSTGVFTGQLPLTLTVTIPDVASCQISPLNIPLSTTGNSDFGPTGMPNVKTAAPFASGTGSVLGSWTDVGLDDVKDVAPTPTGTCATLIGGLLTASGSESFDGTIWLSGTSTVTGTQDPDACPTGTHGTPPNCITDVVTPPPPGPAKITKAKASPGKLTIKRKKKGTLKVAVTNGGESAATSVKVCATAPAKLVAKPKCVTIKSIAAGKSATAAIKFTAKKKKGTGKIKVSVSGAAGKASTTAKLKIK